MATVTIDGPLLLLIAEILRAERGVPEVSPIEAAAAVKAAAAELNKTTRTAAA